MAGQTDGQDRAPAAEPSPEPQPSPRPAPQPAPRPQPRPHRTPRYGVFLVSGALLGLVLGLGLALYGSGTAVVGLAGVLGYFAAFGVLLGGLAGGTVAMVVESVLNRGQRKRRRGRSG